MEHTKKYLLVEPQQYQRLKSLEDQSKSESNLSKDTTIFSHPNAERVHELNNEMKKVLDNENLTDFDKASRYGEKLQSYLANFRQALTTPKMNALIGQPRDQSPNPTASSPENAESRNTVLLDSVLTSIPKSYKTKATNLIDFLKQQKNITWNSDGHIMHNNKPIPHSNIKTLVSDVIRYRKPASSSTAIQEFLEALESEGYVTKRLPQLNYKIASNKKYSLTGANSLQNATGKSKVHARPSKLSMLSKWKRWQ
jgi:hypothetical protein